jgi:acyl-CoA thioester hydrolase
MKDFFNSKRIYYHDTDCGGVVYYANYLKYLEESRTDYFAQLGISLKDLSQDSTWFVVARVEINYKYPARYQDNLKILTRISKMKNVSIEFFQKITKEDLTIIEADTTLVCVGSDFKPKPIPDVLKDILIQQI